MEKIGLFFCAYFRPVKTVTHSSGSTETALRNETGASSPFKKKMRLSYVLDIYFSPNAAL